jgi:hypothetical protein
MVEFQDRCLKLLGHPSNHAAKIATILLPNSKIRSGTGRDLCVRVLCKSRTISAVSGPKIIGWDGTKRTAKPSTLGSIPGPGSKYTRRHAALAARETPLAPIVN